MSTEFDAPQSRAEAILQNMLGANNELEPPQSRAEAILQNMLGANNELEPPQSREEQLLMLLLEQGGPGGGGDITLTTLNVNTNGTTDAPEGTAYNKVVASVPNTYAAGDEGKVVSNGALVSQTAHAQVTQNGVVDTTLNNSVEVDVPVPTLESKSITANGTYTPTSGKAWNEVVVDVPPVGTDLSSTYSSFVINTNEQTTLYVYGSHWYAGIGNYLGFKKAVIASTVTELTSAPNDMSQLETIEGGENVTEITAMAFRNLSKLKIVSLPKLQTISGSATQWFRGSTKLETVTLGSVGYGISSVYNIGSSTMFQGCTQSDLTITAYTTGDMVDNLLACMRRGATAATIIIKASGATTYGGASYAAGATIVNSTV